MPAEQVPPVGFEPGDVVVWVGVVEVGGAVELAEVSGLVVLVGGVVALPVVVGVFVGVFVCAGAVPKLGVAEQVDTCRPAVSDASPS